MSGGSGARVNAGTLRDIQLLHRRAALVHSLHDHPGGAPDALEHDPDLANDADCLPFDLAWDPPETEETAATVAPDHVPDHAIDAPDLAIDAPADDCAKLPAGSVVSTVLFSAKSPLVHAQYSQECCEILEHAFTAPGHALASDLRTLTQTIAAETNFEVAEITRLQHRALYDMHRQFKKSFAIQHTRRVYHGTGNARSIARVGFRGAASKRAKFGMGIYTSAGVFPALAYGELTPELTLTFLVVQLHLGPMALGRQDQVRTFLVICLDTCPLHALIHARYMP